MLRVVRCCRSLASVLLAIGSGGCSIVLDVPDVATGGSAGASAHAGSGAEGPVAGNGGTGGSSTHSGGSGGSGAVSGGAGGGSTGGSAASTGGAGASGGSASTGGSASAGGSAGAGGSSAGGGAGAGGGGGCAVACDCDSDGHFAERPGCNGFDCDDDDPAVFDGQSVHFDVASLRRGFDYDCNGQETPEQTALLDCSGLLGLGCTNKPEAFLYQLPDCGQPGAWGHCVLGTLSCQAATLSASTLMKCK